MKVLNNREMSPWLKDRWMAILLESIPVSEEDIKKFVELPEWIDLIRDNEIGNVGQYLLANRVGFLVKYRVCKTTEEAIKRGAKNLDKILRLDRSLEYDPLAETEEAHQSA